MARRQWRRNSGGSDTKRSVRPNVLAERRAPRAMYLESP
jgi:hypothetical protein